MKKEKKNRRRKEEKKNKGYVKNEKVKLLRNWQNKEKKK